MAQLVGPLVLIHVDAVSDPYCLSCESASLIRFLLSHLDTVPVSYMILAAHMIHDGRHVGDACRPCISCSSECSCGAFHFFAMFFHVLFFASSEPVTVSFGVWTEWTQGTLHWVGPQRNGQFGGRLWPIVKYTDYSGMSWSYLLGSSSDAAFPCQYFSN